jgi:hypothetical protein
LRMLGDHDHNQPHSPVLGAGGRWKVDSWRRFQRVSTRFLAGSSPR